MEVADYVRAVRVARMADARRARTLARRRFALSAVLVAAAFLLGVLL
jgi:hypothetical protein